MRRGHRQIGGRLADPQSAGDVQIDVGLRSAAAPPRVSSTASSIDSRAAVPADHRPPRRCRRGWARAAPAPPPAPGGCPPVRRTPRCRRYCRAARRGTGRTGLATSARPRSVISNTPISSVAPKRFFTARRMRNWWPRSPSKYSTASTMCSSTRGPAMAPSLVTWPTSTSAKFAGLGQPDQLEAAARTCVTVPGALSIASSHMVWIESITTSAASPACSRLAAMSRRLIAAASSSGRVGHAQPAGAQADLLDGFLAGDVQHAAAGAREARRPPAAAGWTCRCRDRRRPAPPRPAPARRPAPGRVRRCRWGARRRFGAAGEADELRRACPRRPWRPGPGRGAIASSTMVFHSPQASQRPAHFGVTAPQDWQTKREVGLANAASEAVGGQHRLAAGGILHRADQQQPFALALRGRYSRCFSVFSSGRSSRRSP